MVNKQYFKDRVFGIQTEEEFEQLALELFRFQAENNTVYKEYLSYLKLHAFQIDRVSEIPFLPISFFKTHQIKTGVFDSAISFSSSGTGDGTTSKHAIADLSVYENSFNTAFGQFYGNAKDWCILALLPSYLERQGSSLIYMAEALIQQSEDADSNFYLNQWDELYAVLQKKKGEGKKTLLLGVSFGLLDFVERYQISFDDLTVMETGGMKGRRKEMIRTDLHAILKQGFGVKNIHSEYGMTELLSQGYSKGEGRFNCPPWMKIITRQTDDPFSATRKGKTGGINVIDLANIDSCAFIETQDLGRIYEDDSFEVMGRFDNSDIRGCNLMVI
ncbi:Acyl-protein synthetase, LuxE [Owenweeksia hongkongensis DSM 17368]|uniref:Acyl-protein synthetase, LuxE n=1 Tax=Owenweeksia hongkongensis (strain DSM 17368 / CIP 108786 / JCM 12287 / NRRL B-23963 / UST20020801) TaxID=926562 RepID=G8R2W7_OWEHD|nr:acyltransferase [Owenweeksia hongkongensis]AEV32961.1 Acyl-protein synthetase, LuxE [Owenweeksia hongkongensis DSM 17368]